MKWWLCLRQWWKQWGQMVFVVTETISAIILLSLFLFYVSPHNDSGSDIVSALSILVTVLIGWNIYTILDVKNIIINVNNIAERYSVLSNEFESLKIDYNATKSHIEQSEKFSEALIDISYAISLKIEKRYIEAVQQLFRSLFLFSELDGYRPDEVFSQVDSVLRSIVNCIYSGNGLSAHEQISIDHDKIIYKRILDQLDKTPIVLYSKPQNEQLESILSLLKAISDKFNGEEPIDTNKIAELVMIYKALINLQFEPSAE